MGLKPRRRGGPTEPHSDTRAIPQAQAAVRAVLDELPERQVLVLELRHGLDGGRPRTLQEVAEHMGSTREWVRQIERKAYGRLRTPMRAERLKRALATVTQQLWETLSDGQPAIVRGHETRREHRVAEELRLAVAVAHGAWRAWLSRHFPETGAGWHDGRFPNDEIQAAIALTAQSRKRRRVPCPLGGYAAQLDARDELVQLAALLGPHVSLRWGYVVPWKSKQEPTERLIRLHVLLSEEFGESFVTTQELVARHNELFPARPCRALDAQRVLGEAPHLFVGMPDMGWTAIGSAGTSVATLVDEHDRDPDKPRDFAAVRRTKPSDRAGAILMRTLTDTLAADGPTTTTALKRRVAENPAFGGSVNSVAPWLVNCPAFRKVAPAVWTLWGQPLDPVHQTTSALLDEAACRTFVLARRAAEPRALYPLWTPAMEHAWCVWAEQSASRPLFHSLLAIVEPNQWPVRADERARWHDHKRRHGRYELARPCPALDETPPSLQSVLSVALYVRHTRSVSWLTANRAAGLRIDSGASASALALLIGLHALVPSKTWQGRHRVGVAVHWVVKALCEERHLRGTVAWNSALGRLLLDQLSTAAGGGRRGWLQPQQLDALVDLLRRSEGAAAHPRTYWSERRIVTELRARAHRQGYVTLAMCSRRLGKASMRVFGSFSAACDAAGVATGAAAAEQSSPSDR